MTFGCIVGVLSQEVSWALVQSEPQVGGKTCGGTLGGRHPRLGVHLGVV